MRRVRAVITAIDRFNHSPRRYPVVIALWAVAVAVWVRAWSS